MASKESSEVPHVIVHGIAVAAIADMIKSVLLPHERIRILSDLVANSRIVLEKILQRRMVLHEFSSIQQRGILANLFGDFAMFIQEAIELRNIPAIAVAVFAAPITIANLGIAVVAIFLAHERVWILPQLVANSRMVSEKILQRRMALHEFSVVRERRILAHLFGNLTMSIEEAVELRQIPAVSVALGISGVGSPSLSAVIAISCVPVSCVPISCVGVCAVGVTIAIGVSAVGIWSAGIAVAYAVVTVVSIF